MTNIVVRGQAAFMFVNNKDRFGKYSIEVTHLDDDSVKHLEAAGLGHRITEDSMANVEKLKAEGKNATFKGKFIRARSGRVIPVVDKDGNAVTEIIGNGSKIQAIIKKFTYTAYGGGSSAGAEKVLVEELVPYVSEASEEEAQDASAQGDLDGFLA